MEFCVLETRRVYIWIVVLLLHELTDQKNSSRKLLLLDHLPPPPQHIGPYETSTWGDQGWGRLNCLKC